MKTLIINFKNYREVLGEGSVRLSQAAEREAAGAKVRVIVAPPTPMLGLVASKVSIPVYSQTVGPDAGEKSTGVLIPESVRAAGCQGAILNHSESRRDPAELTKLVPALGRSGLEVCLCAGTAAEAAALASLKPRYLAIEPPELIGSGVAVSRAKPRLVSDTVLAARDAGYDGPVLCGAGIVDGEDVRKAVELGSEGVLVSSSIVKAAAWQEKVRELARSLI
jgi:triosephosphate isomerase (TIM)